MDNTLTEKPSQIMYPHSYEEIKLDCSLRLMAIYHVGTDQIFGLIDVLIPEKQKHFNIALSSTDINNSALKIPKGIESGTSIQVNSKELIGNLRALADKLEQELSV